MRDTAERQLRAYVVIEGFEVHLRGPEIVPATDSILDPEGFEVHLRKPEIRAGVTLKNVGQTPGYDFQTWTMIRLGDLTEEVFGDVAQPVQSSIIGPNTTFNAPSLNAIKIADDKLSMIKARSQAILVWGEATYRDIFGARWTFRFRGRAMGPPIETRDVGRQFIGWGVVPAGYEEIRLQ